MIPHRHTRFADFLAERLSNRFGEERASALEYLQGRGIRVTIAALGHWLTGIRVPGRARMEMLLDALDVYGDERLEAYRLASGVETDEAA